MTAWQEIKTTTAAAAMAVAAAASACHAWRHCHTHSATHTHTGETAGRLPSSAGAAPSHSPCLLPPLHERFCYLCCVQDSDDDEVLVPLDQVLVPHPDELLEPGALHGCVLATQLAHAGSEAEEFAAAAAVAAVADAAAAVAGKQVPLRQLPLPLAPADAPTNTCAAAVARQLIATRIDDGAVPTPADAPAALLSHAGVSTEHQAQWLGAGPAAAGSSNTSVPTCDDDAAADTPDAGEDISNAACWWSQPQLLSFRSEAAALYSDMPHSTTAMSRSSSSPRVPLPPVDVGCQSGQGPGGGSSWVPSRPRRSAPLPGAAKAGPRPSIGALAAAGFLQVSPGVFMPTPRLLGKLLSRNGRRADLTAQHIHTQSMFGTLPASTTGAAGNIASSSSSSNSHEGAAALVSGAEAKQASAVPQSVSKCSGGAVADDRSVTAPLSRQPTLAAQACAASPVCGERGGSRGGFGMILVRRRFARGLQPVAVQPMQLTDKCERSNSV